MVPPRLIPMGASEDDAIAVEGPLFRIGRASDCDFRLTDRMVSRYHCELIVHDASIAVRDLRSANGTFVNGHPVDEGHRLRDGDILTLATLNYRFQAEQSEDAGSPWRDLWTRHVDGSHDGGADRAELGSGPHDPSCGSTAIPADEAIGGPLRETILQSRKASKPLPSSPPLPHTPSVESERIEGGHGGRD